MIIHMHLAGIGKFKTRPELQRIAVEAGIIPILHQSHKMFKSRVLAQFQILLH
jgi:hypothetical protein